MENAPSEKLIDSTDVSGKATVKSSFVRVLPSDGLSSTLTDTSLPSPRGISSNAIRILASASFASVPATLSKSHATAPSPFVAHDTRISGDAPSRASDASVAVEPGSPPTTTAAPSLAVTGMPSPEYPGVKTLSPPSRTMPSMPETVTSPKTVDEDHDMSPEMPHERRPVPDTAVPPPNVNVSPGLAVPTRPPSDSLSV